MNHKIFALTLVISFQAMHLHAQRLEPGTGYWYEGVITHEQGKAILSSNEPRPLRQAAEALAEEYGWTVDYEDPIYSDAEGLERTEPGFVATHPNEKQHLVAGHKFESEFAENGNMSAANEKVVLQKVISDYNKSRNPGKFGLLDEGGGRFAVIGTKGGNTEALTGVLDSAITIDIKGMNAAWALSRMCDSLTASSGVQVRLMRYPQNVLAQTQVSLHAENEPARDVLRTLLSQAPQKLMWSVLYDIDDKIYYLNLIPVAQATVSPTGQKIRLWVH